MLTFEDALELVLNVIEAKAKDNKGCLEAETADSYQYGDEVYVYIRNRCSQGDPEGELVLAVNLTDGAVVDARSGLVHKSDQAFAIARKALQRIEQARSVVRNTLAGLCDTGK